MIQHPAILSLLVSSAIISLMMLFAGWHGFRIIGSWDLESGNERQLRLERMTYLISTILGCTLFFQLLSLFLFIYTADYLHGLFVGAMCAAGSLSANSFGYPVLILKIVTCLSAGAWLVVNHVDGKGYDYPLIRQKYALLLAIVPFVIAETVFQFLYFGGLKANVITSCCGSLFSSGTSGIAADIAALPMVPMESAFFSAIAITCLCGVLFSYRGKGGYLFAGASTLTFVIALASLVSFISLYVYELPTHHCPFCILQKEYRYIGYPLYAAVLGAGISGLGIGALMPARKRKSLARIVPAVQRKLAAVAIVLYLLFTFIVVCQMTLSALKF